MQPDGAKQLSQVRMVLGSQAVPQLIWWSTIWRPGRYSPFDSYALRTRSGWVLIDPETPAPAELERLRDLIAEEPVATVLTSDGHERACYDARREFGTPVWGPEVAASERGVGYDGKPDRLYREGDVLPGGLRAIKLNGAWGGDHALLWQAPSGERVCFSGDVLNGQVAPGLADADHFRSQPGLYFGSRPEYAERHPDRAALAASLRRLLDEPIDIICGAHAMPFTDQPHEAIRRLLKTLD